MVDGRVVAQGGDQGVVEAVAVQAVDIITILREEMAGMEAEAGVRSRILSQTGLGMLQQPTLGLVVHQVVMGFHRDHI